MFKGLLSGSDDKERRPEQEHDEDDRGYDEREESGAEPTRDQPLPGQTGQDRSRSAEPGEQVPEPEQHQPRSAMRSAEMSLSTEDGAGDAVAEAMERQRDFLGLHQAEKDETGR